MIINDKRELAYVVAIDEIKPIEGYDRVEYARTNGWWCIISKNDNLQVGDKCVYFEVDSKVNAEDPRFAFLDKRHYKIKTQKMCKVVSQGLLMPLKLFPELGDPEVNTPVTDILKVTISYFYSRTMSFGEKIEHIPADKTYVRYSNTERPHVEVYQSRVDIPEWVTKTFFVNWLNDTRVTHYLLVVPEGTITNTGQYEIDMK